MRLLRTKTKKYTKSTSVFHIFKGQLPRWGQFPVHFFIVNAFTTLFSRGCVQPASLFTSTFILSETSVRTCYWPPLVFSRYSLCFWVCSFGLTGLGLESKLSKHWRGWPQWVVRFVVDNSNSNTSWKKTNDLAIFHNFFTRDSLPYTVWVMETKIHWQSKKDIINIFWYYLIVFIYLSYYLNLSSIIIDENISWSIHGRLFSNY